MAKTYHRFREIFSKCIFSELDETIRIVWGNRCNIMGQKCELGVAAKPGESMNWHPTYKTGLVVNKLLLSYFSTAAVRI
ncbi:hypothetical protein ACOSP7_015058 [Xanthoceras sorbifolium]